MAAAAEETALAQRPQGTSSPQRGQLARSGAQGGGILVLPEEHKDLLEFATVKKMDEFAMSMKRFKNSYDTLVEYIGPHKDTYIVKPTSMPPPPPQCAEILRKKEKGPDGMEREVPYTLGELGERLFLLAQDVSLAFCHTFSEYQKLTQGEYYVRLDSLFELQEIQNEGGSDDKIEWKEFAQFLPLNEITKNVEKLTEASVVWSYMANLFMTNIHAQQHSVGPARGHVKHLEKSQEELDKAQKVVFSILEERRNAQGDFRQAAADHAALQAVQNQQGGMRKFLENQKDRVMRKREEAEKQEKDYTFKCYGPIGRMMWQADVDLARKRVEQFRNEERQLEEKIANLSTRDDSLRQEASGAEFFRKMEIAEKSIKDIDKERLPVARENVKVLKIEIDTTVKRIGHLLKKNGATNVDNFLDTMDAMKNAGKSSNHLADGGTVVASGWIKDVNFLGVLLNRMSRGRTLTDQKKVYKGIKHFTAKPDNMLCQVLMHARPVLTLDDVAEGQSRSRPSSATPYVALAGVANFTLADLEAELPDLKALIKPVPPPVEYEPPQEVVQARADRVAAGEPVQAETVAESEPTPGPEAEPEDAGACEDARDDYADAGWD